MERVLTAIQWALPKTHDVEFRHVYVFSQSKRSYNSRAGGQIRADKAVNLTIWWDGYGYGPLFNHHTLAGPRPQSSDFIPSSLYTKICKQRWLPLSSSGKQFRAHSFARVRRRGMSFFCIQRKTCSAQV